MGNDAGQALIELALIMPIFTVLLAGAGDFARLAYAGIEVSNAAGAGVQYGAQNRITALDIAGMKLAATNDGADVSSIQATASNSCVCTDGTSITCANAATACVSPARTLQYVQVNTSAEVSPFFHYPGLPATFNLQGQATMRVQQ
jgi:Flp pilus assembly protein TadG